MTAIKLQTGIWYEDREQELVFPDHWQVETHWPDTPAPMSDEQIADALDNPRGCPPLAEQLAGKRSLAIVVDDLSRPTPVYRALPQVLARARHAGIPASNITVVVATGTHGHQDEPALRSKLGDLPFDEYQVEVHNDLKGVKRIGKTSYNTPVYVNRTVLDADFLIGIGGVYPQHSTGFGGGGKLALGISGRQTIMGLHFKHESMSGRYITDNDFRKDVCEVARMIGLSNSLTLHIDAHSNVVNALYGDHSEYYEEAAGFSLQRFLAPPAKNADIVVANAYPLDISFTFMRKGYKPLYTANPEAVRIMVAAAHEGIGVHGLFQHINPSFSARLRNLLVRISALSPREVASKIVGRIRRKIQPTEDADNPSEKVTILPPNTAHLYIYRPHLNGQPIPDLDDVTICENWDELLAIVCKNHFPEDQPLRVSVYPCAPIQCIEAD